MGSAGQARLLGTSLIGLLMAGSWLFCPAAAAQTWKQEPTGYRGVAFGASVKGAERQQGRFDLCSDYEGGKLCSSDKKIADVAVHELWMFTDGGWITGRLASVAFTFDSKDYTTLREIFVEKYGEPVSVSHDDLQTLMGARATNETLTWKGEKVSVRLRRYSDKITQGMASVDTNAYRDAVSKKADVKRKKAKDSF